MTSTPTPFLSSPVEISNFVPSFAIVPKRPPPCCVYVFFSLFGPICLVRFIVTFLGNFFLLTLLYLFETDFPFDSLTRWGILRLLNKIFCLGILAATPFRPFASNYFFSMGCATEPIKGPANTANKGLIGKNFPFCCPRLLRLPPIYQTPLSTDCFLILKSHRLDVRCYVFCDVALTHSLINCRGTLLLNVPKFLALAFL